MAGPRRHGPLCAAWQGAGILKKPVPVVPVVPTAPAVPGGVAFKKPASLDALRSLISARSDSLTPRQREAARYAIDHPNDIALQPLAQVARSAGVAASAFIRLAQALGFSGYVELQNLFREPLQRAAVPSYRERVRQHIRHFGGELAVDNPADPTSMLRAFSQANALSLQHLHDDAQHLPLKAAVALIGKARMVHVLGLRRSFAVAAYLAYALNRVGRPAVHITGAGGAIGEQASAVGPQDLLIAISFPPYAGDTLRVCEQVQSTGAGRLAITDSLLSPVARGASLVLQVNDAELLGFRSLTSALCLAQTLAMGMAFAVQKRAAPGSAQRKVLALQDIDC
jgi:DNA-binding MurR/RpiR family transcriptional regulator